MDGSAAMGIGEGGGIGSGAIELGVGAGWIGCVIGVLSSTKVRIAAPKQPTTSSMPARAFWSGMVSRARNGQ
jgi:hypothetical protein